ncbi:acyl-CoA dehydrogenase family protein [Nocardia sp. CA-119907]|uniref:acyl-CoA dehydrogenase family protein n=1 Tax=Nocardia sp. CA-119907 TaxID=3239973 RepID=UPI003D997F32
MNTVSMPPTTDVHPVVQGAQDLIPLLREHLSQTAEQRRLPDSLLRAAADAGLFGLLVPASLGGAAAGLREFVDVARLLGQGDPSAAWTMSFLIAHNWLLARWPEPTQREVFTGDDLPLMAFSANSPNRVKQVPGGYELTGRWGFCSGVMNATWVQLLGLVDGENGPELGLFLVPRDSVEVPDTWFMTGMQGTGSHDVVATDLFVDELFHCDFAQLESPSNPGSALHPEPVYSYDMRDILMPMIPAILLGAAQGLEQIYRQLIETRRGAFSFLPSADTPVGQLRYAKVISHLRTGQALLDHVVQQTVSAASHGPLSDEARVELKLDCLSVSRSAYAAMQAIVHGSGVAIFRAGDITQHFARDIEVMYNHRTVDQDGTMVRVGEVLLGRATDPHPTRNFT